MDGPRVGCSVKCVLLGPRNGDGQELVPPNWSLFKVDAVGIAACAAALS